MPSFLTPLFQVYLQTGFTCDFLGLFCGVIDFSQEKALSLLKEDAFPLVQDLFLIFDCGYILNIIW